MDLNQVAEYVRQFEEGDTSAFEELYKLTSKRVYFVCLNMLKNEQDANDATQDTYLTVCKNIRQLSDPKSFPSWVESIALNRCKNILKKKTPIPIDDDVLKEALTAEDELTLPEEYILKEDKRKTLLKIMREELSELQFQTILLYYFSNFSIAEISEIMECSEGAVKNRLSVARVKIKKYVDEHEKETGGKMFVFAGIPFLTKLFSQECEAITTPSLSSSVIKQAGISVENIYNAGKVGLRFMSKKVIIASSIAATVVVVGVGLTIGVNGKSSSIPESTSSIVSISSEPTEASSVEVDTDMAESDSTVSVTSTTENNEKDDGVYLDGYYGLRKVYVPDGFSTLNEGGGGHGDCRLNPFVVDENGKEVLDENNHVSINEKGIFLNYETYNINDVNGFDDTLPDANHEGIDQAFSRNTVFGIDHTAPEFETEEWIDNGNVGKVYFSQGFVSEWYNYINGERYKVYFVSYSFLADGTQLYLEQAPISITLLSLSGDDSTINEMKGYAEAIISNSEWVYGL